MRSSMAQASALFFALLVLVFASQLSQKSLSNRVFASVMIIFGVIGIVRSMRSGYLVIDTSRLIVRTWFRTRVYLLSEIRGVEVLESHQVTPRVVPVIRLNDGRSVRLSEFFMQKVTYNRNPTINKVNDVVAAISAAINRKAS